jgi:hypothetical protein
MLSARAGVIVTLATDAAIAPILVFPDTRRPRPRAATKRRPTRNCAATFMPWPSSFTLRMQRAARCSSLATTGDFPAMPNTLQIDGGSKSQKTYSLVNHSVEAFKRAFRAASSEE